MKLLTQYKRENPDTVLGEKITIVQTYSSFNKEKIDKLEQYCKEHIGYVLVTELKEESKPDCGNCKKSPYNINEAGECYLCWHGYSNKFESKGE